MTNQTHKKIHENQNLLTLPEIDLTTLGDMTTTHTRGTTYFELSNHLGNVLAVVTDRKIAQPDGSGGIAFYLPDMVSATDYYPFGFAMEGRGFSSDNYRYGFNGMEKDNEVKGSGNSYTTEFRQLDVRIGRWLSVDPLMAKFPHQSPYIAFDNNPVYFKDSKGLAATGGGEKIAKAAKEADNKDTRTYYRFRGDGWKTDTYVDCSEFVYEILMKTHNINVGTYTEDIKNYFTINATIVTDVSAAEIGDVVMWVDKSKKGRSVTHVGIVTDISGNIATVTHASSSKNEIASNVKLNLKGDGKLGKLEFVGFGRLNENNSNSNSVRASDPITMVAAFFTIKLINWAIDYKEKQQKIREQTERNQKMLDELENEQVEDLPEKNIDDLST